MNFLQLTQRLRQECGVAGTGPVSTVNQIGEARRLVDWINAAWLEIQGLFEWSFLQGGFSFTTTATQGEYTPANASISDFRSWKTDTLRVYPTSVGVDGEVELDIVDYDNFKSMWRYGRRATGQPIAVAVRPRDDALMLGPIPDGVGYTVVGEYNALPVSLSGDTATPALPTDLHMVIVYKAMQYYAMFESAPEVKARADAGYQAMIGRMERDQLEPLQLAGSLV